MIPGLTRAEEQSYMAAMNNPAAKVTAKVDVLNLNHQHLASFQQELIGGSVQHNRGGDVARQASLTLADTADDLVDLDLRHLVQVHHGVEVAGDYLWCPMFTGQVAAPADNGDGTASLECFDKMVLALQAGRRHRPWHKGMPVGRMIHDMFEDIGETRFNIPRALKEGGPRLTSRVVSGGPDEAKAPGRVALRVTRGRLQVFYDALGRLTVRRIPDEPVVTWTDVDLDPDIDLGSAQTSPIRWSRDLTTIRNTVVAKGKKKLRVTVDTDDLMKNHIYSPGNLQRGGKPQSGHYIHYWANDKIAREKLLRAAALKILRQVLAERSGATLDCVPTPWVGPHDLAAAERRDGRRAEFFLDEATIPILGDGDMTVGYQQVSRKRRGRRARVKL